MRQDAATIEGVTMENAGGRAARQGRIESILRLAEHLPDDQRLVVRQVFEFGIRVADIAAQSRQPRGNVYRRIRRIISRLRSRPFAYVAAGCLRLPERDRRVARLLVLHGMTHQQTAAATHRSMHAVRRVCAAVGVLAACRAG